MFGTLIVFACWRPCTSWEEPYEYRPSRFTAHVWIVWKMLHPHGPTWWRDGLEITRCRSRVSEIGQRGSLSAGRWYLRYVFKSTCKLLKPIFCLAQPTRPSRIFILNKPMPLDLPDSSVPLNHLPPTVSPLTVENVLWSNTVLAPGSAISSKIHAVMNTSHPETKVGLLDLEINSLAKVSLPFYHCWLS